MVLAHLLVPNRWRGIRWTVLSRSFAERTDRSHPVPVRAEEAYPNSPPDPAVFEDVLNITRSTTEGGSSARDVSRPPNILASVVQKRDWTLATRLRDEALEDGSSILPNTVFANAAMHVLRTDGDATSFAHWLRLYPDSAALPSVNPLETLLSALLEHSSADPTLLYHFGLIMAEKGFHILVRHQVLPFISQSTSERKNEYVAHLETALLPEILPPPTSTSIFEEEDLPDYLGFHPTPWSDEKVTQTAGLIEHIEAAVRTHDFTQAEYLLYEAEELGIEIPCSEVYLIAVNSVFDKGGIVQFEKWFSFVPPYHERIFEDFAQIRTQLFWQPVTNMGLIIPFLQICAQKGYIHIVFSHLDILTSLDDEVVLTLHETVQDNIQKYMSGVQRRNLGLPREDLIYERIAGAFRAILRKHGRSDVSQKLEEITKQYLEQHFAHETRRKPLVSDDSLASSTASLSPSASLFAKLMAGRTLSTNELLLMVSFASTTSSFASDDQPIYFESLSQCLLYLRDAASRGLVPHPWTLMNFYERYKQTGRTRAIDLLRLRYFRTMENAAVTLMFTEMVYYFRRGQYGRVTSTYIDNFYLAGVPRTALSRSIQRSTKSQNHRPIPSRGKLWPLPVINGLIWQCLAIRNTHVQDTEELYTQLLAMCRRDYRANPRGAYKDIKPLRPREGNLSSDAFTYFLRKLMEFHGAIRGIRILSDMAEVGIMPDMYTFTEVAGFAARSGDLDTMHTILNQLEREWDAEKQSPGQSDEVTDPVEPEGDVAAAPDIPASLATEHAADGDSMATQTSSSNVSSSNDSTNLYHSVSLPLDSGPETPPSLDSRTSLPLDVPQNAVHEAPSHDPVTPPDVNSNSSASMEESRTWTPVENLLQLPVSYAEEGAERWPETPRRRDHREEYTAPKEEILELDLRFVFYRCVMRGLLIRHDFENLREVHARFMERYNYEEGSSIILDGIYHDWRIVMTDDEERWPARLRIGRTTVGALPGQQRMDVLPGVLPEDQPRDRPQ